MENDERTFLLSTFFLNILGPDSIPVVKGCEGNSLLPWIIAVAVEGVLLVVSITADVMLVIKVRKMLAKEGTACQN